MLTRLRGEIYLFLGAFLFAFNGIISKIVLLDEISAWRLTQIRTGGAFLVLFSFYIIFRRNELKPTKQELPWLLLFGIVGVTLVQAFYFVAIERMYVGIALQLSSQHLSGSCSSFASCLRSMFLRDFGTPSLSPLPDY